ncbi:transmembrane protein, putative (macronuclear) [Tetrahymena thermophila SB210]|uniref:Transmembrane protein, putative n=1 Tax=Tetrahymena thermophila (strain SB210) TaxID=312017 RepID=W7X216_TETTS|nr:transmembrane protein, putative [Tetrahymena thermophila SB210]EWS73275.1 transmembrane protein, putative [Tetrahymena thermophila SB210]|eukprot:XP_012654184.1 transmembrane protein, putative [Tetrahymena thermophila SB210]
MEYFYYEQAKTIRVAQFIWSNYLAYFIAKALIVQIPILAKALVLYTFILLILVKHFVIQFMPLLLKFSKSIILSFHFLITIEYVVNSINYHQLVYMYFLGFINFSIHRLFYLNNRIYVISHLKNHMLCVQITCFFLLQIMSYPFYSYYLRNICLLKQQFYLVLLIKLLYSFQGYCLTFKHFLCHIFLSINYFTEIKTKYMQLQMVQMQQIVNHSQSNKIFVIQN